MDEIFGNEKDNTKANEIKAAIENKRFGGGASGEFLKRLQQKLPGLTVGTLKSICKKYHRNDIVEAILKRFEDQDQLFEVLVEADINKLNVSMDVDDFWLDVAESKILEKVAREAWVDFGENLFSSDEKDNIKAIGPGKFQSCTVSLLEILKSERSDITVKDLAGICGNLGINDAKNVLLELANL